MRLGLLFENNTQQQCVWGYFSKITPSSNVSSNPLFFKIRKKTVFRNHLLYNRCKNKDARHPAEHLI